MATAAFHCGSRLSADKFTVVTSPLVLGAGFIDPRDWSICVIKSSFLEDLVDVFVDLEVGTGGGSFGPRYLKKQGRSSGSVFGAIACISS